jgi:hypothetical protein
MRIDPTCLTRIQNNAHYKRLLPSRLYWSGIIAIILQTIGMVGIFIENSWHSFLLPSSAFGVFLCFLTVGMQEEENSLHDNWRLRIYRWVLGLLAAQILLTNALAYSKMQI